MKYDLEKYIGKIFVFDKRHKFSTTIYKDEIKNLKEYDVYGIFSDLSHFVPIKEKEFFVLEDYYQGTNYDLIRIYCINDNKFYIGATSSKYEYTWSSNLEHRIRFI